MTGHYLVFIGFHTELKYGQQYYVLQPQKESPCECKRPLVDVGLETSDKHWWCIHCEFGAVLNTTTLWIDRGEFVTIKEWEAMSSLTQGL